MHSNMWLKSGNWSERGKQNMPTRSDEKDVTTKEIHKEQPSPKGHQFVRQEVTALQENPSWEQESCNREEKEKSKQEESA